MDEVVVQTGIKDNHIPLSEHKIETNIVPYNAFYYCVIKRLFDIIISAAGLLVLSPLMLVIAAMIRIEDGGPVIYASTRIGTGLKQIRLYKFRSMIVHADEKLKDLLSKNDLGSGPRFKMKNDPRITKVGRVLRKLSLDELPQLWNVLKGDISVVGPRPHSVYEVEKYDEYALQRFLVKSGILCFSECEGRSKLSFEESIELDIKYLRERGLLTDLKILLMAVFAILKHDGAE